MIQISDPWGQMVFGEESDLHEAVHIRDTRAYPLLAFRGSVGAGEAYMQGYWHTSDLTNLIRIITRNQNIFQSLDSGLMKLTEPIDRTIHYLRRNYRKGSRRNIRAHYDLGNDFFSCILDETMMYSCAVFEHPNQSLKDASINKLAKICRKLELKPGDHLLEIGTGWGGMAMFAALNFGCRVTTTTISKEQYELANKRIHEAGLSDRISVIQSDYRDLEGLYDKLVSIEMIEAVGQHYWDTYFDKCSSLTRRGGRFLLQSITIAEEYFEAALKSVDFIKRYIFPGSCIPAVSRLTKGLVRAGFRVRDEEDITPHYARTLRLWRENFFMNENRIRSQGYPDRFIKMWDFYLSYCEAGFSERHIGDFQFLAVKD